MPEDIQQFVMHKNKITKTALIYFLIGGLEALIAAVYLVCLPTDAIGSVFMGFSASRLAAVGALLAAFGAFHILSFLIWRRTAWLERLLYWLLSPPWAPGFLLLLSLALFAAGLWGSTRAPAAFSDAQFYLRLLPIILWVTLTAGQLVLALGIIFGGALFNSLRHLLLSLGCMVKGFLGLLYLVFGGGCCWDEADRAARFRSLLLLIVVPAAFLTVYLLTAVVPMLYLLTGLVYYPLAALLLRMMRSYWSAAVPLLLLVVVSVSRLLPTDLALNSQDLTIFKIYDVRAGEAVEQDFYLPEDDPQLLRLLADPGIDAVLRLLGNFDVEETTVSINGNELGTLAALLVSDPQGPFSGNPVSNYIIAIPKDTLSGGSKVTIRIESGADYQVTYSSGIHPLPPGAHSRLVKTDGSVVDLAAKFSNGRFRFQNGIYLISNRFYSKKFNSPLVFGTIL